MHLIVQKKSCTICTECFHTFMVLELHIYVVIWPSHFPENAGGGASSTGCSKEKNFVHMAGVGPKPLLFYASAIA